MILLKIRGKLFHGCQLLVHVTVKMWPATDKEWCFCWKCLLLRRPSQKQNSKMKQLLITRNNTGWLGGARSQQSPTVKNRALNKIVISKTVNHCTSTYIYIVQWWWNCVWTDTHNQMRAVHQEIIKAQINWYQNRSSWRLLDISH